MKSEKLLQYDYEPFLFLEGGMGLNEIEDYIYKEMVSGSFECWSLEQLYEYPDRLRAIPFLKPKTIVFGTSGVYEEELSNLIRIIMSLDLSGIEKVVLTLDTENEIGTKLRKIAQANPALSFHKLLPFCEGLDGPILIRQIEL